MIRKAVIIDEKDNIATATVDLKAGEKVDMFLMDEIISIDVAQNILFGHKFAIKDIPQGAEVLKYGESIDKATQYIQVGQHVHVHNVESQRGRGDLNNK